MQSLAESLQMYRIQKPLPQEAHCPRCGYFDVGHPDVRRILLARDPTGQLLYLAQCRCKGFEEQKLRADLLRRQQANLPHAQLPRTLENFSQVPGTEEALVKARAFAKAQVPRCLVLIGEPGTGKSHLLESIGRAFLASGCTVRYETALSFLDRLRATFDESSDRSIADLMDWYASRVLVLLDDIARSETTDWASERLLELVDERIRNGRWLAVATNLSEKEMGQVVGDRLVSRLFQKNAALGEVARVALTCGDYRRRTG